MTSEGLILNIETATTVCSVSVSRGQEILAVKELDAGYTHAENLHVFIQQLISETGSSPQKLDAVALSMGPGSYTGLRIGSSTAKGLCFALHIPLITIDTLQLMAWSVRDKVATGGFICPMIDAGRMEVYTSVFDMDLKPAIPVQALILDNRSKDFFSKWPVILFAGQGMEKARTLLEQVKGSTFADAIRPSARHMAVLSAEAFRDGRFAPIRDFEPFYLKNFVAGRHKS